MDKLEKAFGLPESIDPTHVYVFRTGEYGVYDYMYKDNFGNYYKYTNAPKDHPAYDEHGGDAILLLDQPSMSESPEYYDQKTMKRLTMAIPQDAQDVIENEAYSPDDPQRIWHTSYTSARGDSRFVYVETDVIENFDLWAAHVLRLTDSMLTPYRRYCTKLFDSKNVKDRLFSAILILSDQAMFEPSDLVKLSVGDVEFIDKTVKIMGRKLVPDPQLLDFFVSITVGRLNEDQLFELDTAYGKRPIGVRHIYSMLKFLKVNSHALLSWHLSQSYTRIMSRLLASKYSFEDAEAETFKELAGVLSTASDLSTYVAGIVRTTVENNYKQAINEGLDAEKADSMVTESDTEAEQGQEPDASINKALTISMSDDFGAIPVFSGLAYKTPEELEFSRWLHSVPLHDSVINGHEMTIEEAGVVSEEEAPPSDRQTQQAESRQSGEANSPERSQAPSTQHGTGAANA